MIRTVQRGFTLYELLVTVLVMGIVFGFGVPNLLEFTRNTRMSGAANDLVSGIHLARNEAVKRRVPVSLCASPTPLADTPDCDADEFGPEGASGYFVWVDENANGTADDGEEILLRRAGPERILILGDRAYLHFSGTGFIDDIAGKGDPATQLLFCDARGNTIVSGSLSAARGLRIPPTGRPSLMSSVDEIATLDITCP